MIIAKVCDGASAMCPEVIEFENGLAVVLCNFPSKRHLHVYDQNYMIFLSKILLNISNFLAY